MVTLGLFSHAVFWEGRIALVLALMQFVFNNPVCFGVSEVWLRPAGLWIIGKQLPCNCGTACPCALAEL